LNSIIIGNGVTVQFGGNEYLNDRIIKRAINNINTKNFPSEIYPREIKDWLFLLYSRIPYIVAGEYDFCAYTQSMKESLIYFKERYKNFNSKVKVHHIGFEDYFLVHFLVCYKEKIVNPDRFNVKESLRCLFLDSIYNKGKIQNLHFNFPKKFVEFLNGFDNLFTTNYDWNIERATDRYVNYLHGSFHVLADVYNPESFRNKLNDRPFNSATTIKGYEHLYSNALTSYSGEDKKFALDMQINANIAVEKFVNGLREKPELREQINEWGNSDNQILKNMHQSILLKEKDEELRFSENRSLNNISNLIGCLSILGLSPYNDNHIFESIISNNNLTDINFYYYDINETEIVQSTIMNKNITFIDVRTLWSSFN
jgi:hypothetical protein